MRFIKIIFLFLVIILCSCSGKRLNKPFVSMTEYEPLALLTEYEPNFAQILPQGWEAMMNPNDLSGWEPVRYAGEAQPIIKNGVLTLPTSIYSSMTGINIVNEHLFPVVDYAIYYEARRIEGEDIFGGLSFPYKNSYATLVIGGWGGRICGLSCIDGKCALDNETTKFIDFENDVWYSVCLRVTKDSIHAVLDDITIVQLATAGRNIHLRGGTLAPSLTFFTFMSSGQFRNMRMKRL